MDSPSLNLYPCLSTLILLEKEKSFVDQLSPFNSPVDQTAQDVAQPIFESFESMGEQAPALESLFPSIEEASNFTEEANGLDLSSQERISEEISTSTDEQEAISETQKIKRRKWTKKDDQQLLDLAKAYGTNWVKVSQIINRTPDATEGYFNKKLKPTLSKVDLDIIENLNSMKGKKLNLNPKRKRWTEEEKERLKELIQELGHNWKEIGIRLDRTSDSVETYFREEIKKNRPSKKARLNVVTPWTEEDNQQLLDLVKVHGINWVKISQIMNRSTDALEAHFNKKLRHTLPEEFFDNIKNIQIPTPKQASKKEWTPKEIESLKKLISEHGHKWKKISELLGRTKDSVENYYRSNKASL